MLEVRLLGTFEVRYRNRVVDIASRPAQSLFAYLILNAGTAHRRERLAGLLWPDSLEESARDYLRHALWRIRKALQSHASVHFLQADDLTIAFGGAPDYWLDAAELENVGESASADELISAVSAYRGELLPGFYDEWVASEREHLNAVYEHRMARLMSLLQDGKRWPEVLDWGERWIQFGQKPEAAYRALMTAHAANGDMSRVSAAYERCVKSLKEFGVQPSEQTKELYENLRSRKEIPKMPAPMKHVGKEYTSNIPVPLTSFVGRERELREIARLLSASRLLTLTGPGGVGKSRLAIQTANGLVKKFKDGVYWVGLVGLSDADLIPQEIARALDIRENANEPIIETLKTHLRPREILLVLDNCEHLIRTCAQVAEHLLAACPKLRILATSTEALSLFNETNWQVPSLPLPEMPQTLSLKEFRGFASIELFEDRARKAKPGFALDEKNAPTVAQICGRLDGIPLAIELAAARIKVLSIDEIAARLDDRFSLLTAGSRTAIPRHQTLRATIDWSYELLTEPERVLLGRLSVFAGGFTLDAAEAVCGQGMERSPILDLLSRLVDKSLVIVEAHSEFGWTRYRLLETIRQYALEKLVGAGEAPEIRTRHADFYLKLAEQSEPYTEFGGETAVWFRRLEQELDNIRSAIEWSTASGNAVLALRILGSLIYFWFARGHLAAEWNDRIQEALLRPEGRERTLARAKALNGIGFMYWADFDPTDRRPEIEEALSISREFGDRWNTATALRNLGLVENISGNYTEAWTLLEQSLGMWRDMGPEGKMGGAWTLTFLADAALNHDEPERARLLYEDSLDILREVGDLNFSAYSIRRLAQLAWWKGDHEKAIALCRESLTLNRQVNDPRGIIACLAGFADIAVAQGKLERAARLMAAVESQLSSAHMRPHEGAVGQQSFLAADAIGIRLLYIDRMEYERSLALLREHLDKKVIAMSWATGRAMTLEQAIAFALEEG